MLEGVYMLGKVYELCPAFTTLSLKLLLNKEVFFNCFIAIPKFLYISLYSTPPLLREYILFFFPLLSSFPVVQNWQQEREFQSFLNHFSSSVLSPISWCSVLCNNQFPLGTEQ